MKILSATQGQIIQSIRRFSFCLLNCYEVQVNIFDWGSEVYVEVSWIFESLSSNRVETMIGETHTLFKFFWWDFFT